IDDDESLRQSLVSLFRSVGIHTRMYASPGDFLAKNPGDQPGCIVLDIRLPGMNGLDFQIELRNLGIPLPVILISGHGAIPMSVRAMKAGAVDFLPKPFRDQDLLDSVAAAIQRDSVRRSSEAERSTLVGRFETLTPRERQVMLLVTAGKMNKEI